VMLFFEVHSHLVINPRCRFAPLERWAVEVVAEYLSDEDLARGMLGVSPHWHFILTDGAWARRRWHAKDDADDAPAAVDSCCARGRYLALMYAPERQRRREVARLRAVTKRARERWHAEREPLLREVRRAKARLSVVAVLCVLLLFKYAHPSDAAVVIFWPLKFVWRASSIPRLAHDLLLEEKKEGFFRVAEFLAAPDALAVRRYAFGTSIACCVVAGSALLAWWRCLFYALGALVPVPGFDVATTEFHLKTLRDTSKQRRLYKEALREERRRHSRRPPPPLPQRRRRRRLLFGVGGGGAMTTTRVTFRAVVEKRVVEALAAYAELARPLLRVLVASSAFVVAALLLIVATTPHAEALRTYVVKAALIFLGAVKHDLVPVFFVVAKLGTRLGLVFLRHALTFVLFGRVVKLLCLLLAGLLLLSFLFDTNFSQGSHSDDDDTRRRRRPHSYYFFFFTRYHHHHRDATNVEKNAYDEAPSSSASAGRLLRLLGGVLLRLRKKENNNNNNSFGGGGEGSFGASSSSMANAPPSSSSSSSRLRSLLLRDNRPSLEADAESESSPRAAVPLSA